MESSMSDLQPQPTAPAAACRNCGAILHGRYCHICGQEDRDLDVPFRELAGEWLGNFLAFDARVWRTLALLARRPGRLTVEYLAGRRARYVPPLKLYLFISLLLFLVLGLSDFSVIRSEAPEPGHGFNATIYPTSPTDEAADDEAADDEAADDEAAASKAADDEIPDGFLGNITRRFLRHLEENPGAIDSAFRNRLAQTLFLLVPVFALYLQILFRRRKREEEDPATFRPRRYQHHLVVSLHLHCAVFLMLLIAIPVDRLLGYVEDGPGSSLAVLGSMVYLVLTLRRVYAERRRHIAWKTILLLIAHAFTLLATLLATLVLTALTLD